MQQWRMHRKTKPVNHNVKFRYAPPPHYPKLRPVT